MVHRELDSFYNKFKNLLSAEKDATLTFKSEAGRAFVTLSLDLGHVLSGHDHLPPGENRNGSCFCSYCARMKNRPKRLRKNLQLIILLLKKPKLTEIGEKNIGKVEKKTAKEVDDSAADLKHEV